MSDQGELRDRIAAAIAGEEEHPHPRGYTKHAQAIIDDLGLTAEHGATHGDGWVHELEDQDEAEQMVRWNPGMHQVSRVVGRWERQ